MQHYVKKHRDIRQISYLMTNRFLSSVAERKRRLGRNFVLTSTNEEFKTLICQRTKEMTSVRNRYRKHAHKKELANCPMRLRTRGGLSRQRVVKLTTHNHVLL